MLGAPNEGRWTIDSIYELFPRLAERKKVSAAQLSGGEQQMLAIARALLPNPRLLVMDEPSEGLAPAIVENLSRRANARWQRAPASSSSSRTSASPRRLRNGSSSWSPAGSAPRRRRAPCWPTRRRSSATSASRAMEARAT